MATENNFDILITNKLLRKCSRYASKVASTYYVSCNMAHNEQKTIAYENCPLNSLHHSVLCLCFLDKQFK